MNAIPVVYNAFWTDRTIEKLAMEGQLSDDLLRSLANLSRSISPEHMTEVRILMRDVDRLKQSLAATASILRQYQADMERGERRILEKITDAEDARSIFLSVEGSKTRFMS